MYFKNRADAGRQLAQRLHAYRTKNCVVLAMGPGAVLVGAHIANELHADLFMLLTEKIMLPGEPVALAAVSPGESVTYNTNLSSGEIEELKAEFYNVIESERFAKMQKLHALLGPDGDIPPDMLRRRTVILVSDGLSDPFELDIAADYLKPIKIERLVIVTPFASVNAVDSMHLRADEIQCLSVSDTLYETDHYYDDNTVPDIDGVHKIMRNTPLNWHLD